MKKLLIVIGVAALLQGCVSNPVPMSMAGGGVVNQTPYMITDFSVRVESNNRTISCNIIPAQGFFAVSLPLKPIEENSLTVQWKMNKQVYSKNNVVIPKPEQSFGETVGAIMRIFQDGRIEAEYLPVSEIRRRYRAKYKSTVNP